MYPVLFTIGKLSISSFGFFLALAFLFSTFLVWRLARAWDLDEEKVLDLILLTFFGGLIGSRLFFVALNLRFFLEDLSKIILVNKYPGLSFWGGLLGGWLTLYFFSNRKKLDFWQVSDLAAVGLLGGLILGDLGCFLGGCSFGITSNLFFAVKIVGVKNPTFPIQLVEALLFLFALIRVWPLAVKFHFHGRIVSLVLIVVGVIKFFTEFLKYLHQGGFYLSLVLVALGMFIYYKVSKQSFKKDLPKIPQHIFGFLIGEGGSGVEKSEKSWYNGKSFVTKFLRRIRVKPTPKDFQ